MHITFLVSNNKITREVYLHGTNETTHLENFTRNNHYSPYIFNSKIVSCVQSRSHVFRSVITSVSNRRLYKLFTASDRNEATRTIKST